MTRTSAHALQPPSDTPVLATLEAAEQHGLQPGRIASLYEICRAALELCETRLPALVADGTGPEDVVAAARHLVSAGGKRIRPMLLVLSARACQAAGSDAPELPSDAMLSLMVAAELTHTATLLHDDVLDNSEVRRGQETARMRWGNAVSVLAGDFVLTRALEEVLRADVPGAMPAILETIRAMIAGEALQLSLRGRGDVRIPDYERVVDGKTGALFAFCGRAGALCAGTPQHAALLATYARHLGRAFQIVDDVLDIDGDAAALGKTVLQDLREGKLTLPVLLALDARPELRDKVTLPCQSHDDALPDHTVALLRRALVDSDATRRARRHAAAEAELGRAALATLPPGRYRDALWHIGSEVVDRSR